MVNQRSGPEKAEIYHWSMLNDEGKSIVENIQQEWINLVANKDAQEAIYSSFLAKHAVMFFGLSLFGQEDGGLNRVVISNMKLDNRFHVDFVVAVNDYTIGIDYKLIKILLPLDNVYTKEGTLSRKASQAIDQVYAWDEWLETNQEKARLLFPSAKWTKESRPRIAYHIIAGTGWNKERYAVSLSDYPVISLSSFDSMGLIGKIPFKDFMRIPDSIWKNYIPPDIKNKMSNPFFKALSHEDWIELTQQRGFQNIHLVSSNVNILLRYLQDNGLSKEFRYIWEKLSLARKEVYQLNGSRP